MNLHEQLLALVSDDTDGISPALDTALSALRAVVELLAEELGVEP